jgi:hypothetical protein
VKPAGKATLDVKVDRAGNIGPIEITVGSLPDGVTAEPLTIQPNTSKGRLVFEADEKLGDETLVAKVSLTAAMAGVSDEKTVKLTVPRLQLPGLTGPAEGGRIVVMPGTEGKFTVRWDRHDHVGGLEFETPELPEHVTCEAAPLAADADVATVKITVADECPDGAIKIPIETKAFGRTVRGELVFDVVRHLFNAPVAEAVRLTPGERRRVEVPVERIAHDGPITFTIADLPDGVSAEAPDLAAAADQAAIDMQSADDAAPVVRTVQLIAAGGGYTARIPLVVRVVGADGAEPPLVLATPPGATTLMKPGSIGGRLARESKQTLLARYGGTDAVEDAVSRGLGWLRQAQQPDGTWGAAGGMGKEPPGGPGGDDVGSAAGGGETIAVTATALLPFLAEGYSHKRPPKGEEALAELCQTVEQGLVALAKAQVRSRDASDGFFGASIAGGMAGHCLATMAFCEDVGLSRDSTARVNAVQGVKFLQAAQDTARGGWATAPGEPGDLIITHLAIAALQAAQQAGLAVKGQTLRRAADFLKATAVKDDDPEFAATRLLSGILLGWPQDDPEVSAGIATVMQHLPPAEPQGLGPLTFLHRATRALHQSEAAGFDLWNQRMRDHLLRTQRRDDELAGSWDPPDEDGGNRQGRVVTTAVALLTLQVYYRHLPLVRQVERPTRAAADGDDRENQNGGGR